MKASELVNALQAFIAKNGDGDVQIEGCDEFADIARISETEEIDPNTYAPTGMIAVLYTDVPLIRLPDTDQSIGEELDDIGRDMKEPE